MHYGTRSSTKSRPCQRTRSGVLSRDGRIRTDDLSVPNDGLPLQYALLCAKTQGSVVLLSEWTYTSGWDAGYSGTYVRFEGDVLPPVEKVKLASWGFVETGTLRDRLF